MNNMMTAEDIGLPPHLQRMVNLGMDGADIIHGELKTLMVECEQELESVSELQEAPAYNYISGKLDTLTSLYKLTYDIAFAKGANND